MPAEYVSDAADISCRKLADNADNLNVAKIPEYGNDIENRIDGQSLLADESGRGFSDTGSSLAVIFVRRYGSS
jgi:hypothetical protein